MNTLKQYQALCDAMSSKEYADGAVTVEYVVIVMVVVGLGAALFAFREQIVTYIGDAGGKLGNMLNNLSAHA